MAGIGAGAEKDILRGLHFGLSRHVLSFLAPPAAKKGRELTLEDLRAAYQEMQRLRSVSPGFKEVISGSVAKETAHQIPSLIPPSVETLVKLLPQKIAGDLNSKASVLKSDRQKTQSYLNSDYQTYKNFLIGSLYYAIFSLGSFIEAWIMFGRLNSYSDSAGHSCVASWVSTMSTLIPLAGIPLLLAPLCRRSFMYLPYELGGIKSSCFTYQKPQNFSLTHFKVLVQQAGLESLRNGLIQEQPAVLVESALEQWNTENQSRLNFFNSPERQSKKKILIVTATLAALGCVGMASSFSMFSFACSTFGVGVMTFLVSYITGVVSGRYARNAAYAVFNQSVTPAKLSLFIPEDRHGDQRVLGLLQDQGLNLDSVRRLPGFVFEPAHGAAAGVVGRNTGAQAPQEAGLDANGLTPLLAV